MDGNSSRSHWSCARRPWKIPLDLLQPTSRTDTGDALPGCAQRQAARPRPATLVAASSPLLPGRPPAITTAAQLHPPAAGHSFFVPIGFVQGIAAASVRDRIISRRVRASVSSGVCSSAAGWRVVPFRHGFVFISRKVQGGTPRRAPWDQMP